MDDLQKWQVVPDRWVGSPALVPQRECARSFDAADREPSPSLLGLGPQSCQPPPVAAHAPTRGEPSIPPGSIANQSPYRAFGSQQFSSATNPDLPSANCRGAHIHARNIHRQRRRCAGTEIEYPRGIDLTLRAYGRSSAAFVDEALVLVRSRVECLVGVGAAAAAVRPLRTRQGPA